MVAAARPSSLPGRPVRIDPAWPSDLRVLLGPDALDLATEYFGALDADVVDYRPRQVAYRPRRSTTVRYDVHVRWSDGTAAVEPVVAMIGGTPPEHTVRFGRGDDTVAMWHWPHDPFLPGLPAALDPEHVGRLFADLGLGTEPPTLRVRAYRPGRRAVVEADNGRARVYLKVVRPRRAAALHDTHRALADELPVPNSIGWTDDGIVVLPGIAGDTLRDALLADGAVPDPADVEALLDRLPASLLDHDRRSHWLDTASHHAGVIRTTVPAAAARACDVLARLTERADTRIEHPVVPIHGDLYESQLMVERGRLTGLLDVDTAGAGHRVDDLANFCAHLSVLALVCRPSAPIRRYGARLLANAENSHDPVDLRLRIAAAVLGLATGSFRVLEADWAERTLQRIGLADEWIASADRVADRRRAAAALTG